MNAIHIYKYVELDVILLNRIQIYLQNELKIDISSIFVRINFKTIYENTFNPCKY